MTADSSGVSSHARIEGASLLGEGFGLIEAPLFEAETGSILFSDASQGGAWRLRPDGEVEVVAPHRKGIGGMVRHADGGIVISGRNVSWRPSMSDGQVLLDLGAATGMKRFNDLAADGSGRLFVGALDYDPDAPDAGLPGMLILVELDGTARIVDPDVKIPNGMGVTVDGRVLYVADTGAQTIWRYELHDDGGVSQRTPLISWPDSRPDGLLVDGAGRLFVALRGPNCVCVIDPAGREERRHDAPGAPITSVALGGPDGRSLFVTSGAHDRTIGAIRILPAAAERRPQLACRVRPDAAPTTV